MDLGDEADPAAMKRLPLWIVLLACLLTLLGCRGFDEMEQQGLAEIERLDNTSYFQPEALAGMEPRHSWTQPRRPGTSSYLFEFPGPEPTERYADYGFDDAETADRLADAVVAELIEEGSSGCVSYSSQTFLTSLVGEDELFIKVSP